MNIKEYMELVEKSMRDGDDEEKLEARNKILFELKHRSLGLFEIDYLRRGFFKTYLNFIDGEVFLEILKNLSRQNALDETRCRNLYAYLNKYNWVYESYIVMRLFLLEKFKTIARFCEEYTFYIDGTPQFLEEPVWENIDFRKDFDNNFE